MDEVKKARQSIEAMENDIIRPFALGLYPPGCKFFVNGELSMGGELVAIAVIDRMAREKREISPCDGCSFLPTCKKEKRFEKRKDGLDTNLKSSHPNMQNIEAMIGIMKSSLEDTKDWVFDPQGKNKEEIKTPLPSEIPWVSIVIRQRIISARLKIKITQKAHFLIFLMTEGNPGKAMFVLHKIGNLFEGHQVKNWLVTSGIVTSGLFPAGFPGEEDFCKWWDGQKDSNGANKVDHFPDEWREEKVKIEIQ